MALIAAGPVVASALLDPLCERLINATLEEYNLVKDVKEEIEKLRSTVSLIKGLLQDAEQKQVKDEAVCTWLRSLKQVLYDAEDVLDEAATNAALHATGAEGSRSVIDRRAKVCNMICCFGGVDKILNKRDIAHQIKAIRVKLNYLSKEKDSLGLRLSGESSWPNISIPRRLETSSMLADESYMIGRDGEKKNIIELLLGSREGAKPDISKNNVHVISIIGMGGVGKTTLAKLVFNDTTVKQHFQPMMWVCVSNNFDLKRITEEIMDAASTSHETKELCKNSNWDTTQKRLKDKIEGKRFLLVLDDMWEEEDPSKWESLCEPLKYGQFGSKIIVTSRSQKASEIVKGTPIFLRGLSSKDLWLIFERYAFEDCDSNKHVQLVTIGRQIVKKLKGSPLAAKTIGRLLSSNLDMKYWKHIMKSEISLLTNDITPILQLSYDHLPGHLKQCFASCSLFPKDHRFSKDELVHLWTAQNFVQSKRGFHAESIAREHFDDLLQKSFFEQNQADKFMMHDLIHDLAESVSEDDYFRLEDNGHKEISKTVRHVSLVTNNFDLVRLKELCKNENLRTLLILSRCRFELCPHLNDLFMMLKRLRVLRLCRCKIKELPTSIGTLKHLRFLDLSETLISKLPESLCNLHNLQVLGLNSCRQLVALPSNMSALINLRHLDADRELVSNIQGLGKLTALQELNVSGRKVRELADMGMLQELRTWGLEQVESKGEAIQARLNNKEHLDVLELEWSYDRDDHLMNSRLEEDAFEGLQPADSVRQLTVKNYGGVRSPSWMKDHSWLSSSFLQRVELQDCRNWEVLPPLGQLCCLKILKITGMNRVTRIGPTFFSCYVNGDGRGIKDQGFPSLEVFEFSNMPRWEEWEIPHMDDCTHDQGQQQPQQQSLFLPCLRVLKLDNCPMLKQLPPLPPTVTDLQIQQVGLTHLPGWLPSSSSSSPSLSSLRIIKCPNLTSIRYGLLQQPLQKLKLVGIYDCQDLASLPERGFGDFTSLQSIITRGCPKLPEQPWVPISPQQLESFTSLEIHDISKLMQDYGSLPSSLEQLCITGDDNLNDESLSGCLQGLTCLQYLSISNCPVITSLPGAEVLSHLPALQCLDIMGLKELKSLGGIHSLISLEDLGITDCPKLLLPAMATTSPWSPPLAPPSVPEMVLHLKRLILHESSPQQIKVWLLHCPFLQTLTIRACPQLTGFDGDAGTDVDGELETALLGLAPSLRTLNFQYCENLRSLPSKLMSLSSVKDLDITLCPQIQCLPVAGLPRSLEHLSMDGCPLLTERCKERTPLPVPV